MIKVMSKQNFTQYPYIVRQLKEVEAMFEEIQKLHRLLSRSSLLSSLPLPFPSRQFETDLGRRKNVYCCDSRSQLSSESTPKRRKFLFTLS
jgi:hypothetical protein